MTHPFLQTLGLADDADDRAIKRAYARQLKQIDQAADPQGFQALREAYEAALRWYQARALEQASDVGSDRPAPVDAADAATAPQEEPEPAEPSPHADVVDVFNDFMAGLGTHEGDKSSMLKALARCLDDARLQGLDSRDVFEWLIARTLAEGWRPGHEVLLVAAIDFFEWNTDRRRLLRFGRVGQSLDESIAERLVFDGLPLPVHARQKELIRLLRRDPRPDDDAKARSYQQDLEWLVQNLPHWLWMIVPSERVSQWRQWGAARPGTATEPAMQPAAGQPASAARARPSAPTASTDAPRKKTSVLSFFLGLMLVLGFLSNAVKRFDGYHSTPPSADSAWSGPALTQADPFESIRTYGDGRSSQTLPEPIAPPRTAPVQIVPADSPPISARLLASLSRSGATKDVCRRAADIAQTHAADAQAGRAPFGPGFDALLATCLDRNRWPRPGDPVLIAALEREAARAQREYQQVLAAPPSPSDATRRASTRASQQQLDLDSHLLTLQIKSTLATSTPPPSPSTPAPTTPTTTPTTDPGTGLSRRADRDTALPKVEMPKADYRLSTTTPAPLTAPAPP